MGTHLLSKDGEGSRVMSRGRNLIRYEAGIRGPRTKTKLPKSHINEKQQRAECEHLPGTKGNKPRTILSSKWKAEAAAVAFSFAI